MPVTSLPEPPSRSEPATFADKGDEFLGALPTFADELNELEVTVTDAEISAVNSAASAYASHMAIISGGAVIAWVSGTTYAVGNVRFSPINFQSYRRKTAGAGTTDPSLDPTNWVQLSTVPDQTGNAGKYMSTDGTNATWTTLITLVDYTSRATLRSMTPINGAIILVKDIGIFVWESGSTETDDDETCFATGSGRWLLRLNAPEFTYAMWISHIDNIEYTLRNYISISAAKKLYATFTMSLTTLAALTDSTFVVYVPGAVLGDSVITTPGNLFGTATADKAKLSHSSYISSNDYVTVSIRNSHASVAADMTASTWSILVIKQ